MRHTFHRFVAFAGAVAAAVASAGRADAHGILVGDGSNGEVRLTAHRVTATVKDRVAGRFAAIEADGNATSARLLAIRKDLNAAKTLQSQLRGLTDPGARDDRRRFHRKPPMEIQRA